MAFENLGAEVGSEAIAQVLVKMFGVGGKFLLGYLVDNATHQIRAEAKTFAFGNPEVIDGLFRRGTSLSLTEKKMTAEDRKIWKEVIVGTISRERQNDYRRILVASCFGVESLKDMKTINESALMAVLAQMIADDAKIAVEHHKLLPEARKHSEWMNHLRFYDLDQSFEEELHLAEYECELDEDIARLRTNRPKFFRWLFEAR